MALPQHGAQVTIEGCVSANADWNEVIVITVSTGSTFAPATGFSNDEWHITFRSQRDCNPALTLSSTDGTLTYTEASTQSLLTIAATVGTLSNLDGNYVIDLASKSTAGVISHWGHGDSFTVYNDPVSW